MVIAILAVTVMLWVILTLGQLLAGKGSDFDYTHERPDEYPKISAFARGLYRFLIFPVTSGFLLPVLIGIHLGCRKIDSSETFPILQLNSFALLLCSFVASGCAVCETGQSRFLAHYQGEEGVTRWYLTTFMVRILVVTLFVEMYLPDPGSSLVPYCLVGCQCLYIIFLLRYRPYTSALNMVGLLCC